MKSFVNNLDSGNELGSSPIQSVMVTSSESMIASVGSDTANGVSTKSFVLAKAETDGRYWGIKLEPTKRLELANEAGSNSRSDLQFSLNTLASKSTILLLGVNDGVDTIEESQDILNQPFGLFNPFVDFNFVNFRGYLEMNYLDGSPISVFPEPEFTVSTEDEPDKPVTLPSGPADGTFLGDGSDYPYRPVRVYLPDPPCSFGPLEPEIIHFTITAERPAQDGPKNR